MNFFAMMLFWPLLYAANAARVPPVVVNQRGGPVVGEGPSVLDNCNFHCSPVDSPICATNGQCMQKFQSECAMSGYNCQNPQKPFAIIENWKCEQSWAPQCAEKDLGPQ